MGGIGIGSRGTYDLRCFLQKPDVQFVAVCDVQAARRSAAKNRKSKMQKTLNDIVCYFLLAMSSVVTTDWAWATDEIERQAISVLLSDAPPAEKAITCKRLAIYGTREAVPALAALLPDEQLASWARIALEVIPDAAAGEALRDATGMLQGKLLIGVINSIGVRRDQEAVHRLAKLLKDADTEVASASAVALGHIGSAPARVALQRSLTDAPNPVRSAVAEGCILCAEQLLATGKMTEAAKLYDEIRQAEIPKPRILEATRGAILARQSAGVSLLVEQLRSADQELFAIGLSVARELQGAAVTEVLATEMEQTIPDRQMLLILALADRNDSAATPAVLRLAKSGPPHVRIVALRGLKRLGNASCLSELIEIALEENGEAENRIENEAQAEIQQAVRGALIGLPGEEVDTKLVVSLSQASGALRKLLIEIAGGRRITAATPALLEACEDTDAQIRTAALLALGSTVGPSDLDVLVTKLVTPERTGDSPAVQRALRDACVRMPDREACAAQLADAMSEAPLSAQRAIVEVLGAMGGTNALATVATVAQKEDLELQDAATRALGQWMTVDAAPVLLELAKPTRKGKYQIRALRGFLRIVRQFDLPKEQRTEMCRAALKVAQRDAERTLALEVLRIYPSKEMLVIAIDVADDPVLKETATKIAVDIARQLGDQSADVQKLLARVGYQWVNGELVPIASPSTKSGARIHFKKTQLDPRFRSEGIAVGDYNHDGKDDIAAGFVWFSAPDWKMHVVTRDHPWERGALVGLPAHFDPNGYSNSFINFAEDLNGDGWTDLIVVDFPGTPTWWFENPRHASQAWKRHQLIPVTNNESPQLVDLHGDGSRDLVAAFSPDPQNTDGPEKQFAYFTPQSDPTALWVTHPISAKGAPGCNRYSHGIGIGDVNDDGHRDILVNAGWWEAPAAASTGKWKFHSALFGDAAQMYVYDFDGDGDNDVLSSSPHAFGIWWHEQLSEAKWHKHEIDKDFSQTHAVCVADINDDGLMDVVTGKRWWAHGGADPGSDQPAVLVWFELRREPDGPVWIEHLVDDDSGVGTQFEVSDVNCDGMLDIVTSNKKGVYYFEQVRE